MCICDNKRQSSIASTNTTLQEKYNDISGEKGGLYNSSSGPTNGQSRSSTMAYNKARRLSITERLATAKSVRTQTYNYVLGISSLWLLWPSSHGLYNIFTGRDNSSLAIILTISTIVTALISTLMWKKKIPGSLLFKADITAASFTMLMLVFKSSFGNGRPVSLTGKVLFPMLVAIPWIVTCAASSRSLHLLAFIGHNTFRYFGCWWVYYSLEQSEKSFAFTFIYFSCFYFMHIGFSVAVAQLVPRNADVCKTRYLRGCLELVLYVTLLSAFHAMYNM